MSRAVITSSATPEVWTIVVAGGSGTRFGKPKQFELIAGRMVINWSTAVAAGLGSVVAVVPSADLETAAVDDADIVVAGGSTRSESVRLGLAAVPQTARAVLVHDAARPLADRALFDRVLDAVSAGAPAVIPVVPVADSLRWRTDTDQGGPVIDRASVVAVQTPQGFDPSVLRRAHDVSTAGHGAAGSATDDASLVEALGVAVTTVPGDPANFKITTPVDLSVAIDILTRRSGPS